MTAEAGLVARVVTGVVGLAVRRPLVTVIVVLGLSVASLFYTARNLGINTDTADMISPTLDWRQDFIEYRESFPARDRNLIAVIEGPDGASSEAYARDLVRALENEPALFPSVFFPAGDAFFERNALLFLPFDELQTLADRLIEAQPILGRLSDDVSAAGLLGILVDSIEEDSLSSVRAVDNLDRIFGELTMTLNASGSGRRRPVDWGELIGFTPDVSARQLVVVRPALDFSRVRPAREAIERVRETGAALAGRHAEPISLRLTGTLAMEHEELTSITESATAAGLAALVMVALVLLWAVRSPVLLVIALTVLLSGLILTAGFAALTVGQLNLMSVAFAVLYIGLGVDFILHMSLRVRELRADGIGLDRALTETARGVGSSLLICAVTTAAGFFAFVPTDFDGVSELGIISGGGMIISLVVSLSLLPALIKLCWHDDRGRRAGRGTGGLPFSLYRPPPGAAIAVAAAVGLLTLFLLPALEFDGNPIHLRDPDAESIEALEDLAADSEAPLFNLAVTVPNSAAAEATADALGSLSSVESVRTVASFVPADQLDKLIVIEDLALVLGPTLRRIDSASPDAARMLAELENLSNALSGSVATTEARRAFREAAGRWLAARDAADAAAAADMARNLESDILGDLVDRLQRLERGLAAEAFTRNDLPAELSSRWVNAEGAELVEASPRENLNDNDALARFVRDVRSVAPNATGLPVVYEEAAATVTRAFSIALAYAFGIVSLLLIAFLRSVRDAAFVLVPIVFAAVLTAGGSVLLGLPLNFANIIALPLLIGVGVDSGIHMVHRMRTEPPGDGDPLHTSTSRAVLMSALTTIASFGNLAFSTHLGMASMGQLLTLGMAMSLVAVLGLLPAFITLGRRA